MYWGEGMCRLTTSVVGISSLGELRDAYALSLTDTVAHTTCLYPTLL